MEKICSQCNEPFNATHTKRKFCSDVCYSKHRNPERLSTRERVVKNVTEFRRRLKQRAIDYLGGKCIICGYNKYAGSLQFHHRDPTQKDFAIAGNGATKSWERVRIELDKCALLCANCHGEVHAGVSWLPDVGSNHGHPD